jgi:hypothetical protein
MELKIGVSSSVIIFRRCALCAVLYALSQEPDASYENSFLGRKIINAMIVFVLVLEIEKKQNDVEDEDDMKTG